MKKQLSTIKIHSFVDVITNSSTELFVLETKKKIEAVKEIVEKIIEGYNIMEDSSYTMEVFMEPFVFNLEKYRKWKKEGDEKRAECEKSGDWSDYNRDYESGFSILGGWFYDDENEEDMKYLRKHIIEYGKRQEFMGFSMSGESDYRGRIHDACLDENGKYNYDYKKQDAERDKIYEELVGSDEKPDWWDEPWKHYWCTTLVKELDGCVILCGSGDNSVPYDIWETINRKLNGTNYHLG